MVPDYLSRHSPRRGNRAHNPRGGGSGGSGDGGGGWRGHGVVGARTAKQVRPRTFSTQVYYCRTDYACPFKLEMPDSGAGVNMPAIWHGAGVYPGVLRPETKY